MNKKNERFWTKYPMTYVDFKKPINQRLPKLKKDFIEINRKIIIGNPDFIEIINKYKEKIKNKIVLDLGCGFGSSSIILSKIAKKIFSIDLTKLAVDNAKINFLLNKIKNIKIIKMDAEKMKFNSKFFDFVFSWGVIHHSQNPNKIFKNIFRVLKNKGCGFMMVYNFYSFRYLILSTYYLFIRGYYFKGLNYTTVTKKFTDGYYNKHYRKKDIIYVLKNIGFKNIKVCCGHYKGRILPLIKSHSNFIGRFLSSKFGYFLYVYFEK